jgi:hypothetical protein
MAKERKARIYRETREKTCATARAPRNIAPPAVDFELLFVKPYRESSDSISVTFPGFSQFPLYNFKRVSIRYITRQPHSKAIYPSSKGCITAGALELAKTPSNAKEPANLSVKPSLSDPLLFSFDDLATSSAEPIHRSRRCGCYDTIGQIRCDYG